MTLCQKPAVSFFDKYSLVIPPKLIWHQDGIPGQRVLFISDKKETVVVSFEEGMKPVDMTPDTDKSVPTVSYQCCKDGKQHCLAGQIVVDKGYQWTDGVEPILMELLEGIAVCKTKGGGND